MRKMAERAIKRFSKGNLPPEIDISVKASLAKKGEDLVIMDMSEQSSFTDIFIIVHGNSNRQNLAICENIEQELRKDKIRPLSVEGRKNAEWILMDYGNFIVHIFSKRTRDYYSLEKLWGDCPKITY